MALAVVGISHHTAPVEVRERLAFGASEASRALLALRDEGGIREAVLLSTCNRTEVYLFPVRDEGSLESVEAILRRKAAATSEDDLRPFLFREVGDGVVRHLFEVTAGLDSLVTGEAEIQGQVRDAYERSTALPVDPPMAGRVLNRLFQTALAVGGRVRAETSLGRGSASVASVAVELARKIFGSLDGKRVLILGAGATSEIIVEALSRHGVEGVVVANRTYDRAVNLARQVDGHAVPFGEMAQVLSSADIVLASTAAPHHVLTRDLFRSAFPDGRRRPLLIIDIGVPRDVDPEVGEEPEVYLFNVDDLHQIVEEHVKIREGALPQADLIIAEHESEFGAWYASRQVVPVIRRMRRQAEDLRTRELERLLQGLDHLDEEDRARVEEFSRRLTNKLLHDPTVRLRKGLGRHGVAGLVEAMRFLYGPGAGEDRPGPEGDEDGK
jgi:glutamyl-tRNA reductase